MVQPVCGLPGWLRQHSVQIGIFEMDSYKEGKYVQVYYLTDPFESSYNIARNVTALYVC